MLLPIIGQINDKGAYQTSYKGTSTQRNPFKINQKILILNSPRIPTSKVSVNYNECQYIRIVA
jgi:hypothetical protein